jgi:hypothetical protein
VSSLGCVGAAGDASKSDDPGVARSGELFGNNTKRRGDQRLSLDAVVQRSRLQADGVQSESATIRPLRFGRFPERLFRGGDPDQRASDALPTGAFIEGGLRLPCVRSLCCLTCTIVRGWASPRQIAMDGTRYYITLVPRWEVAAFPPAAPISCESPGRCGRLNPETAGRNVEDRSRAA